MLAFGRPVGHHRKVSLVERFVAATEWSTAKKTAVLALGLGLPLLVWQWGIGRIALSQSDVIDLRWFDFLYACFVPHTALTGVVSAYVAARGREGRWTAWLFMLPYLALMAFAVHGFGVASALTFVPLLIPVITATILYDDLRFGIVAGTAAVAIVVGLGAAIGWGGTAYAPAFLDRRLEAVASPAVLVGLAAVILPEVIGGFALSWIVTAALRRKRMQLAEARDQLDTAVGLISRYVPAEVASGILSGSEQPSEGHKRQKVTVFFSDIVGFTDLAEELEPEDLALVLNEYFTEMTATAERHQGTVDELQGDGLIILFGAPTHVSDRDHALDAVHMAAEMQEAIARLNDRWEDAGITNRVTVRMGINTGVVTVGHFGSGGRMKYTVLGKHVNLAARIQAACEPGKVLMSHASWLLVRNDVEARPLGELEFKGIVRPVEVHELVVA